MRRMLCVRNVAAYYSKRCSHVAVIVWCIEMTSLRAVFWVPTGGWIPNAVSLLQSAGISVAAATTAASGMFAAAPSHGVYIRDAGTEQAANPVRQHSFINALMTRIQRGQERQRRRQQQQDEQQPQNARTASRRQQQQQRRANRSEQQANADRQRDQQQQQQRRAQKPLYKAAVTQPVVAPARHDVGQRTRRCARCNALLWPKEVKPDGTGGRLCCSNGRAALLHMRFPNPAPQPLRSLMTGNTLEARAVQKHLRAYNCMLQLAYSGIKLAQPDGFSMISINGSVYHQVHALNPPGGMPRRFGQLYLIDDLDDMVSARIAALTLEAVSYTHLRAHETHH